LLLRRQRSGSWFEASQGKYSVRPYLEKPFTKIGLVEWLKVKALSSSPSTAKKQNNNNNKKTLGPPGIHVAFSLIPTGSNTGGIHKSVSH
jgi:hypothetical protein